jgi:hypothetical protein
MVSHCACPTRVFRDRALHEHRRPASLPTHAPSKIARFFSSQGSLVDPQVRASNEHLLSVRVPRARGRPGCPSHPSQDARSGSTGPMWVSFQSFLSWGLCEQEGHLATPIQSHYRHWPACWPSSIHTRFLTWTDRPMSPPLVYSPYAAQKESMPAPSIS